MNPRDDGKGKAKTVRLCVIWNLHEPNCWHPTQRAFGLPWTRIQTLRSYLPFLQMAEEFPDAALTLAISPDVLRHLEQTTMRATREAMLDLHRKPAAELRAHEVADLLQFGLGAAPEEMVKCFPSWHKLWQLWRGQRGIVRRVAEEVTTADLQNLQVLAQLGWMDAALQERVKDLAERARQGDAFSAEDANRLVDFQIDAMHEFLEKLRTRCRAGSVEYLGAPLHRCVLPLLCGESEGYLYPEDARAQLVRGPRVHYLNFGKWPTVLALPEGGLSEQTAALMGQACLHQAVSSSRVLARSLGRFASASEIGCVWEYRGREILFADAEIGDQIRFVYPHMAAEQAFADLWNRVCQAAAACEQAEASLVVEVDLRIEGSDEPASRKALWRKLLECVSQGSDGTPEGGRSNTREGLEIRGSTIAEAMAKAPRRGLPELRAFSRRVRGFAAWNRTARPLYWKLLSDAREKFQNVRAWKTLAPEKLQDAKASLFVLESADWSRCMEAGLDPYTQLKMEELFRAHLDCVYRSLEMPRPAEYAEPLLPCEVKVTSIGPSQDITPRVDGKTSSYHSWSGSGFYRNRQEGGCARDSLRQLSGVYFGSDSVNVYLRVALPAPAREMLESFELQGVLHASEGEQTVSWFRVARTDSGKTKFDLRLAVPAGGRTEEPHVAVDDVVDLQLPLSGLGVRLGELLRFQVSLWEHGNAVASAPTLGWEEFLVGDHLTYETDLARSRSPMDWGVVAK